ncbi:hypothetical protein TVAG_048000 [Trichomonas vaginalis G3]|uniref:Beige/BEACH domain containing protein n=1 Tax=Trichomonas vaginalis (strain ATCC PRA-98 / G3) TaxID=412133 RepID=A2EZH9_TRIV3|nr:aggrephagy protein [Trichomonas vaginalis G3]EAY01945.1 hypothetical protein TVAG_048000 [Trichomonas vaginalis G3]KAI5506273.1 aggrephagy protein [Trichomonas vaginalis G3]|eukprot:XP_001330460.1 hypothetical protein [Trichomonas vaginalis G3]
MNLQNLQNFFHFDGPKCPVISILLEKIDILSDEESSDIPDYFYELPTLTRQQLYSIDDNINQETHDVTSALKPYASILKFNPDLFKYVRNIFENTESDTKYPRIAIIYHLVSFIAHINEFIADEFLKIIFQSLNSIQFQKLQEVTTILFINIAQCVLKRQDYKWDSETILICSQHFVLDQTSIRIPSTIFFQILHYVIDNMDSETLDLLTDVIIQMLINPKKYFTSEENFRVIGCINGLLKDFNFRAIRVVALVSTIGVTQPVKDCFVVLSSVFVNYVQRLPVFNKLESIQLFSFPETKFSTFPFHECPVNEFEMGFERIPSDKIRTNKRLINFVQKNTHETLQSFAESIYLAESRCTDCFYASVFQILTLMKNEPHFIDLFVSISIVIEKNIEKTSLSHATDFFTSDAIFKDQICAFSGNELPDVIKFIRGKTINFISHSAPSILADILVANSKYPYLAAEIIAHILYCDNEIDYRVFTRPDCLSAISNIISMLWNNHDTDPNAKLAFTTVMDFVFTLVDDEKCTNDCFSSFDFSFVFLSLATERNLLHLIYTRIRNFLVSVKDQNIDFLAKSFNKFLKRLEDDESEIALITTTELYELFIYACSHNPQLCSRFNNILDNLFSYGLKRKSDKVIQQTLKIFSFITMSFPKYKLSSKYFMQINEIIKKNISDSSYKSILSSLGNIISNSNTLSYGAPFLVKIPTIAPVYLASFGSTNYINEVLNILLKLSDYSDFNCEQFHEAGIDSILIDFLSSETNTVKYRGYEFSLNVPKDDLIYKLLFNITREKSSYYIAMKIFKLIVCPPNVEIAKRLLNSQISEVTSKRKHEFPCDSEKPFCLLKNLPSMAFNKMLTFSFWLNVDTPLMADLSKEIMLLKITSPSATFKLFFLRSNLYYSFTFEKNDNPENESTPKTLLCHYSKKGWTFCSFIHQRYSLEKSAVGFYFGEQMDQCQEIPKLQFPIDDDLEFEFGGGGTINSKEIVVVGSFGVSFSIISEERLKGIGQRGDVALNSEESFTINSNMISNNTNKADFVYKGAHQDYKCQAEFNYFLKEKNSLHKMIGRGNHLMSLVPLFDLSKDIPNDFMEIMIGLIKYTIGGFYEAQERFTCFSLIGKMLEKCPSKLNYSIYISFYSIMDHISLKRCLMSLFNGIILNINLWIKSPCFGRIVHHWATMAVCQFPKCFKVEGYFSRLIRVFPDVFEIYAKTNKKLVKEYISLLSTMSVTNLTSKELDLFFSILYNSHKEEMFDLVYDLLILFERIANTLKLTLKKDNIAVLLALLEIDDVSIVTSILKSVSLLTGTVEIIAASIALFKHKKKQEIFNSLTPFCISNPYLCPFCIVLSLSLPYDQKEVCAALIGGLAQHSRDEMISKDKLWFVYPLILLLSQLNGEGYSHCYNFVEHFALKSSENLKVVLDFLQILSGALKIDGNYIAIRLLKSSSELDLSARERAVYVYKAIFFRFCDYSIDPRLVDAYINSPFYLNESLESEKRQVDDVLSLYSILKAANKFTLKFGISVDENVGGESSESVCQMANSLEDTDLAAFPSLFKLLSQILSNDKVTFKEAEMSDVISDFSMEFSQKLSNLSMEICEAISEAKNLILLTSNVTMTPLSKPKIFIPPMNSVNDFQVYMNTFNIEKCERRRSHFYGFAKVPCFKYLFFDTKIQFSDDVGDIGINGLNYTSKNIVSYPGARYILGEMRPICIFISSDQIQIISKSDPSKLIKNEDIEYILEKPPTSIEIFLRTNESFYIDFDPISSDTIMSNLKEIDKRFSLQISDLLLKTFSRRLLWSNFEVLVTFELFTGKTFHVSGLFPEIRQTSVISVPYELYVCDGVIPLEEVIRNRKKTESFDFSSEFIPILGERKPDFTIQNSTIFGLGLVKDEILAVFVFGRNVAIFVKNGQLRFFTFDTEGPQLKKVYGIQYSDDFLVFHSSEVLFVIDPSNSKKYSFTKDDVDQEIVEVPELFAMSSGHKAALFNGSEVRTENVLAEIPGKVTCLDLAYSGSLFACSTTDCKIFVHNTMHNEFISMIQCEKEPLKLLITDSLNFVFADLGDSISIYASFGEFICSVDVEVVCWHKFIYKGIDYVIICDSDFNILFFDPSDFKNPKKLGKTEDVALRISVGFYPLCMVVVTANGRLNLFPLII